MRKKLFLTLMALLCLVGLTQGLFSQTISPIIPSFSGTGFTDTVPDTIDLAEMARLSLNGMTGPVDAADDYSLYFFGVWNQRPAVLRHAYEEGDGCLAKFMAPLVLNRIITNDTTSSITQTHTNIFQYQYLNNFQDNIINTSGANARIIEAAIIHYLRDGNPQWRAFAEQAVRNWCNDMTDVDIDGEDGGYWEVDDRASDEFWAQDPWRDEVLLLACRVFGNKQALETVGKHIRYVLSNDHANQFNTSTGAFIDDPVDSNEYHRNHFHIHGLYLKVFLQYAMQIQDGDEKSDLIDFVKDSYAWAKDNDNGAIDLIGFFPEFVDFELDDDEVPIVKGEGCSVSDMVDLALMLGSIDSPAYYDDADKWIRNQFTEIQLTDEKGGLLDDWSAGNEESQDVEEGETDVDATNRAKGGFAGYFTPNQWVHRHREGIQQCCTGNCARSVFYAWDSILSFDAVSEVLTVNLLMNTASEYANIKSHIPYEGKVEIEMEQDCEDMKIRLPNYITSISGVTLKVNNSTVSISLNNHYISTGAVDDGDDVELTFALAAPGPESYTLGGETYTFTRKGNTVVSVVPVGYETDTYLYDDRYEGSSAPTTSVSRFVSVESDILQKRDNNFKVNNENVTVISGSGSPGNMLDEDFDSAWMTIGSGKTAVLELDDEYEISYILLGVGNGDERYQNIEIKTSTNGINWTQVFDGRSGWCTGDLQAIDVTDSTGKYIKIICDGNTVNSSNSIHTIRFYVKNSYEAENAFFSESEIETEHDGYTGTGYVNTDNEVGSYIDWTVYLPETGTYQADFIFANGSTGARAVEIIINGTTTTSAYPFQSTGGWTSYTQQSILFQLKKGLNTIKMYSNTSSGGPNYDRLDLNYYSD